MEKGQLGPNPSISKANLDIHHKSKLDRSDGIRVEYPHIESLGVNQISWVSSSLGSCSSSSSSSLTCKEDHCSSTGNMSVPQNSLKNGSKTKPRRTKFLGVRQRPSGRWVAEIKDASQKLRLWLGTFDCAEDAARAYDDAARFLRGKNTRTNFAAPENSRNIQPNSSKASRLLLLRHALAKAAQNTTTVQGKALKNADICTATHLDQQSKANCNDNSSSSNSNNVVIEGHENAMTETTHDDQRWVLSSSSGDSAPYNQSHVGINCLISSADMQCGFSQNLAAVPGNGQYNAPTNGTKSINRTVVYGPRPANATSFDTFCTSGWYLQQSFNVSGNQHAVTSSECVNQSRHGKTTSSIRVAPSFNASLYSEAEKFLYRHAAAACSSESPIAANGL